MAERPRSSCSDRWRERGNTLYDTAQHASSSSEQLSGFTKSIHYFQKAIDEAETDGEIASAAKNLAMTQWNLAATLAKKDVDEREKGEFDEPDVYYRKALEQFNTASILAQNIKPHTWLLAISSQIDKCLQSAFINVDAMASGEEKICALSRMLNILSKPEHKAKCYFKQATAVYDEGLRAVTNNDFQAAIDLFRESNMSADHAKEYDLSIDDNELQRNLKRNLRFGEGKQIIQSGITLMEKATSAKEGDQEVKMEATYGAIDKFREAIMVTMEKELEIEAISLSYLGQIYDTLLKQRDKAKKYFMRCLQLTKAMPDQSFVLQVWHITCTKTLSGYQQKTVKAEEQSKREFIKKELRSEIAIITEGYKKDIPGRLVYISQKFPPTKKSCLLPTESELRSKSKKELNIITRKLVIDYHTDKQAIKEKKLLILNEEITMFLNDCIESLKLGE